MPHPRAKCTMIYLYSIFLLCCLFILFLLSSSLFPCHVLTFKSNVAKTNGIKLHHQGPPFLSFPHLRPPPRHPICPTSLFGGADKNERKRRRKAFSQGMAQMNFSQCALNARAKFTCTLAGSRSPSRPSLATYFLLTKSTTFFCHTSTSIPLGSHATKPLFPVL